MILLVPLALLLLAVCLPVVLPAVAIDRAVARWRMRRAAARTGCGRCGRLLGVAALDAADRRLRVASGTEVVPRRRIVREADAVCTACGAAHRFCRGGLLVA